MTNKYPTAYLLVMLSSLMIVSCGEKKAEEATDESAAAQTQSVSEHASTTQDPIPMNLKDEELINAEETIDNPFPG